MDYPRSLPCVALARNAWMECLQTRSSDLRLHVSDVVNNTVVVTPDIRCHVSDVVTRSL